MNKFESEDDILIAKILDKKKMCDTKNKIMYSDFLNEKEQIIIKKNIKLENYFWFGEDEEFDRRVLFFYPNKLSEEIAKESVEQFINVVRITLPNEMKRRV